MHAGGVCLGGAWLEGVCMAGGHPCPRDMCGWGGPCVPRGAVCAWVACMAGGCAWWEVHGKGGMHGKGGHVW